MGRLFAPFHPPRLRLGGNAPKNMASGSLANAFFKVIAPFLGGHAPKKHWLFGRGTGWSCSELSKLALEEHLYSESDKYINGSNIIIKYSDGSEDICGKNATDTFKLFIERHFDDVKRLQYEEFFDIISNDHPFSKFISINVGGKHWYINTNNDTQEKRSIIDYVIGRCDIKATTDYITK